MDERFLENSPPARRVDSALPPQHPLQRHLARAFAEPAHRPWTSNDGPMPALYLSHGAPVTFEDSTWMAELFGWARSLPRPKGILVVSAHWESDEPGMTSLEPRGLVYDFSGFDPQYYRLHYDTPSSAVLGASLDRLLPGGVHEHGARGLDHGAWVPLKIMYPEADIPVVQLSLPASANPDTLMALGQRLRELRHQGVLVIGSGFMTHGLRYLTPAMMLTNSVPAWSREFDLWAAEALEQGDVAELSEFRRTAPSLKYAHPTLEHWTPLFVTLGAASDLESLTTAIEGFALGLSKRSFQVN